MFPIDIQTQPARTLAAIPHKGPYEEISAAFDKISALIGTRGLGPHMRGMAGVYYDDPEAVAPEDLRSYAGAVVEGAEHLRGAAWSV